MNFTDELLERAAAAYSARVFRGTPREIPDPAPRAAPSPWHSRREGDKALLYDGWGRLLAVYRVRPNGRLNRLRDLTPFALVERGRP